MVSSIATRYTKYYSRSSVCLGLQLVIVRPSLRQNKIKILSKFIFHIFQFFFNCSYVFPCRRSQGSQIHAVAVKPPYTDTSLLRQTVCFVPGERKPLRFLHIQPA